MKNLLTVPKFISAPFISPFKITVEGKEPIEITRVKAWANLMDSCWTIPIINKKFGLDPLIGLIPGLGDVLSVLLSGYIVYVAYQLKLSRWVMLQMVLNLVIDTSVGIIPVVGDIIDMSWKSNQKNAKLLEKAYYKQYYPQAPIWIRAFQGPINTFKSISMSKSILKSHSGRRPNRQAS
ncbi:MAG: DUF4112 domain-containing protein [Cyanobacteria bacterium]|nr:DUF4112 domain-containing protein [Cyanobacteriota bacterium]